VFVFDGGFVEAMATQFQIDLAQAERVTMEHVRERPIVQRVRQEMSKELWDVIDGIWGPKQET
jgi:hypothetical protein